MWLNTEVYVPVVARRIMRRNLNFHVVRDLVAMWKLLGQGQECREGNGVCQVPREAATGFWAEVLMVRGTISKLYFYNTLQKSWSPSPVFTLITFINFSNHLELETDIWAETWIFHRCLFSSSHNADPEWSPPFLCLANTTPPWSASSCSSRVPVGLAE